MTLAPRSVTRVCTIAASPFALDTAIDARNHRRTHSRNRGQATMPISEQLRARREATVREHMDSENRQDFEATLATFKHPRYELFGNGEVYDGRDAVAGYYRASRAAVPDQRNRLIAMHFSDDAVFVEFDLMGTNTGPLPGGIAPTGRAFTCRMLAMFEFDGDKIVCERVYFDSGAVLHQLQGGALP
jgi:predicted ester cyclase